MKGNAELMTPATGPVACGSCTGLCRPQPVGKTNHGLWQGGTPDQNGYGYNDLAALKGYTAYRDAVTHEPWLYSATAQSFWTYDDATSLAYKTKWAMGTGLGGVMFWELSGDTAEGALIKALAGNL